LPNDAELYPVDWINAKIPLSDKWLRIQLDRLTEMGFLAVNGIRDPNSNRIIRHYKRLQDNEKVNLPLWENLQEEE